MRNPISSLVCRPYYILICLIPIILYGNGATMGLSGHSLKPIHNDNIKLVSETLKMKAIPYKQSAYAFDEVHAKCWYLLENVTELPQTMTMGFHLGDSTLIHSLSQSIISVRVDGIEIDVEYSHVSDKMAPISGVSTYAIWDMKFTQHEKKMVFIEQELQWATRDAVIGSPLSVSKYEFLYELSLAALWAGKPERIDVYFDLGEDFNKDDSRWGVSSQLVIKPNDSHWSDKHTLYWQYVDVDPKDNISLVIQHYGEEVDVENILWDIIGNDYYAVQYDENANLTWYLANKILYTEDNMKCWNVGDIDELKKLSNRFEAYRILLKWYPALKRNLIYAVHGYEFNDQLWMSLFERCRWYNPRDDFSESKFNEIEKKNIAFILEYEKEIREFTEMLKQ